MKNSLNLNNLKSLFKKYRKNNLKFKYPLLDDAFSDKDLFEGIKVIMSGQLTMSNKTKNSKKICKKN